MKPLMKLLVIVVTAMAFCQTGLADKQIRMYLDYARFRYDDTQTYLEIYYSLYDQRINPVSTNVLLDFTLENTAKDTTLASDRISVALAGNGSQNGVRGSLIKTVLPPGEYRIKMVRVDELSSVKMDSMEYNFTATPFKGERIKVSDLELCSNIRTGSTQKGGLFYKNTMEVYPNPTRIYGMDNPQLFYYVEVYNIQQKLAASDEMLEIHAAIKDNKGTTLQQKKYRKSCEFESLVEIGRFNISKLKNGLYSLMFAVVAPDSEYSSINISNFYVLNQKETAVAGADLMAAFPQSEYFSMSEDLVDERFEQIRYIASKTEVQVYQSLSSLEDKRLFLYKFWHNREMDTPGLQEEYFRRVEYANENFRFANRAGWKSDRGRIYIVYGEPDEYLRKPYNPDAKPYEVWIYHQLDGGCKFLFVDESGFKDYQLKSSTLRGEFYDPSWDQYLYEGVDN